MKPYMLKMKELLNQISTEIISVHKECYGLQRSISNTLSLVTTIRKKTNRKCNS